MNLRAVAVGVASLLVFGCVKSSSVAAPVDVVVGNVHGNQAGVATSGLDSSDPARVKWAPRDEVDVEWRGRWYPASVLETRGASRYLVHYDGYGEEWDEVVTPERMRLRRVDEGHESNEPVEVEADP